MSIGTITSVNLVFRSPLGWDIDSYINTSQPAYYAFKTFQADNEHFSLYVNRGKLLKYGIYKARRKDSPERCEVFR